MNKQNVQTILISYISAQFYTVASLKQSIHGLISAMIIFKRTISISVLVLPIYKIIIWVYLMQYRYSKRFVEVYLREYE